MISKYREDKIKAEFRKLESDLKAQDQKNAFEKQRVKEKRGYYDRQKRKTMEHYATRLSQNDSPPARDVNNSQNKETERLNARLKDESRQRYFENQKKKISGFRNLESSSPNQDTSCQDNSEMGQEQMPMDEDPMRVRGSFYLAKAGKSGFGAGAKQKSPRPKKVSPNGRLGLPKKKAKLRLEPLGPRNMHIRNSNTGRNILTGIDDIDGEQPANDATRVRSKGKDQFLMSHSLCLQATEVRTSERGSMRTLDNQVRAQKIYMSHMQQQLGKEKTGKR